MERIILEVKPETAKKWRSSSSRLRKALNKLIEEQLDDVFEELKGLDSIRYFEQLRDKMVKKDWPRKFWMIFFLMKITETKIHIRIISQSHTEKSPRGTER